MINNLFWCPDEKYLIKSCAVLFWASGLTVDGPQGITVWVVKGELLREVLRRAYREGSDVQNGRGGG